jgi:hypothetical protein
MRDTIEALQDGNTGDGCDTECWMNFAGWVWDQMDEESRRWVEQAVAHRGKPLPLKDVDKRNRV